MYRGVLTRFRLNFRFKCSTEFLILIRYFIIICRRWTKYTGDYLLLVITIKHYYYSL